VGTQRSASSRAEILPMLRFGLLAMLVLMLGLQPVCAQSLSKKPDAVRGIVRAVEQAQIATDLQTRVAKIGFQEGERFRKGDTIVEFDCRKQRAELAASQAQLLEMTLTLDKYRLLQRAQAAGKNDLEIAEARAAKAAAETEGLRAHLEQCTLVAPYDGRVLELSLHTHESPQSGKPFIAIVADGTLEIDMIVPSDWARWLVVGDTLAFTVDETKSEYEAAVSRIGASVDAISQTIKIAAVFKAPPARVLPGMSGTAAFTRAGG
jgi:membrane fusion protein, multidrug efflux system